MGQADEQKLERASRTKKPKTSGGQPGWAKPRGGERCDIGAVDRALLGAAVIAVASAGAAMMVSTTRDGGAVSITVFDDDDKERVYAHSQEEIEWILQGLVEQYGR